MSELQSNPPTCPDGSPCGGVASVVVPRPRDLGGFEVRRVLPAPQRRSVGPFVFFDQMGPATFAADQAMDVRPHPHIGLATVTWLVEGEIMHRDSLGHAQVIRPGDVNWMTAGRGIVHSERTPEEVRGGGARISGIQAWLALPREHEETAPAFEHFPAARMPAIERAGVRGTLIAAEAFAERSPVTTFSETLYAELRLDAGAALQLPSGVAERALYVFDGEVDIDGARFEAGRLLVLEGDRALRFEAATPGFQFAAGGDDSVLHRQRFIPRRDLEHIAERQHSRAGI